MPSDCIEDLSGDDSIGSEDASYIEEDGSVHIEFEMDGSSNSIDERLTRDSQGNASEIIEEQSIDSDSNAERSSDGTSGHRSRRTAQRRMRMRMV